MAPVTSQVDQVARATAALTAFAEACKTGKQYPGNFREAEHLTDAMNLYAVALRANKVLQYDAANVKITNAPDADKFLTRTYRSGWENI